MSQNCQRFHPRPHVCFWPVSLQSRLVAVWGIASIIFDANTPISHGYACAPQGVPWHPVASRERLMPAGDAWWLMDDLYDMFPLHITFFKWVSKVGQLEMMIIDTTAFPFPSSDYRRIPCEKPRILSRSLYGPWKFPVLVATWNLNIARAFRVTYDFLIPLLSGSFHLWKGNLLRKKTELPNLVPSSQTHQQVTFPANTSKNNQRIIRESSRFQSWKAKTKSKQIHTSRESPFQDIVFFYFCSIVHDENNIDSMGSPAREPLLQWGDATNLFARQQLEVSGVVRGSEP